MTLVCFEHCMKTMEHQTPIVPWQPNYFLDVLIINLLINIKLVYSNTYLVDACI
jgi:hypothetical protein